MPIKKGTVPPRYDEAFKNGAVKIVTEQERHSKEVTAELGICIDTLKSCPTCRISTRHNRSTKPAATSVGVNLNPKSAHSVNSFQKKTRSLMF